jgi:hypothetical protein
VRAGRRRVGDAHRRLPAAEPAALDREAVQRAIRHHHPLAFELAVHVRQRQSVLDPLVDVVLDQQQPLPRLPMSSGAFRADSVDHLPDQLVRELLRATVSHNTGSHGGVDVTARRLAINTGPLRDRPLAELATDPLT